MNNEYSENLKYQLLIQDQLKSDPDNFCTFRREKQLDFLFQELDLKSKKESLSVLDLCCGYGRLIYFLNEFDSRHKYHGIDYTEILVNKGAELFSSNDNISFELNNAYEISKKYSKTFDISILHKTLSWLPYYHNIIKELISVTKDKIYITSLFWEGDIDFLTKVYESPETNTDKFLYMNTYSLPSFTRFCLSHGAKKVTSIPMNINLDLERGDNNVLHTFTVKTANQDYLEFTGAVSLNWRLVTIHLS